MKEKILAWLSIFFLMVGVDMVWAYYVVATAALNGPLAGFWAIILFISSGIVTRSFVADKWLLIPGAIGAFVGTWLGIRF